MTLEELDTNAMYFVLMEPSSLLPALVGLLFVIVGGYGDYYWVECKLKPYIFSEYKFKLYAVPVNPIPPEYKNLYFTKDTFYTSDFLELLEDGFIIKKEHDTDFVEHHSEKEYIPNTNGVYIVHEYDTINKGGVV